MLNYNIISITIISLLRSGPVAEGKRFSDEGISSVNRTCTAVGVLFAQVYTRQYNKKDDTAYHGR